MPMSVYGFLGVNECLCVLMGFWMSMNVYGYLWVSRISMSVHGSLWTLMGVYLCIKVLRGIYGCLWVPISVYGCLRVSWASMGVNGCLSALYLNIQNIVYFLIQEPHKIWRTLSNRVFSVLVSGSRYALALGSYWKLTLANKVPFLLLCA